jgi:hypothetical protein
LVTKPATAGMASVDESAVHFMGLFLSVMVVLGYRGLAMVLTHVDLCHISLRPERRPGELI